LALGVLSLFWLWHNRKVPLCPDRIWVAPNGETLLCGLAGAWVLVWPVVVPFLLVGIANVLFLRQAFEVPSRACAGKTDSLWHRQDGGMPALWGSRTLCIVCMVSLDCLVFLMPVMVPYGLVAELLACLTVAWQGNNFNYVTASKACGPSYGSTSDTSSDRGSAAAASAGANDNGSEHKTTAALDEAGDQQKLAENGPMSDSAVPNDDASAHKVDTNLLEDAHEDAQGDAHEDDSHLSTGIRPSDLAGGLKGTSDAATSGREAGTMDRV